MRRKVADNRAESSGPLSSRPLCAKGLGIWGIDVISETEVKSISRDDGVPLANVEKDYVMGWLLWGIYNMPNMANNLVLKGGNCLRKVYFPDTRFSDDLDFAAYQLRTEDIFHGQLQDLCELVGQTSGIHFDIDRTRVDKKDTPDGEKVALDGRVYFKGFAGDASLTMRVKFDVSEFERIVLPVQEHELIHSYSDADQCLARVQTYSLEEVLAEKLRSWIQRTRSRDLFDVVAIASSQSIPISKRNVLATFFQKTIFQDMPMAGKEEMLFDSKFDAIAPTWSETIICPSRTFLVARNAIRLFRDFVDALFDPELLAALGTSTASKLARHFDFGSGFREAIIEAGRARQLITLRYSNRNREVEPYSFRYKWTKKGYGAEYFFGFDRTRGQTIKSFFLHRIQGVSILPREFQPRWLVEF